MKEFNNNNKFIPKAPEQYIVAELKDQQIKKSSLSSAARSKIINRSGSNYLSENEGYGPVINFYEENVEYKKIRDEELQKEKEELERKKHRGLCIWHDCQSSAEIENYCAFHKRGISESGWVWKTTADTAASLLIPGYAVAKAVWHGIDGIKDEAKSEAWDAAATVASGSSSFGGHFSTGMGILSSGLDWKTHQDHVDRGENYRSGCPVCRS